MTAPQRNMGRVMPGAEPPEEEDELDLRDLLAQVLARKWLVVFACLLGGLIGALWGQLAPNTYRAASVVQIEKRSPGVALPSELVGQLLRGETAGSSLETEMHVIRSRLILGPVTEKLETRRRIVPVRAPVIGDLLARRDLPYLGEMLPETFQRPGETVALSALSVPDGHEGVNLLLTVTGPDTFEIAEPGAPPLPGRVAEDLRLPSGIQLRIGEVSAPSGRQYLVFEEPMRNSVARIRRGLGIRERGSTGIVDFEYIGPDPEESRRLVNTVVETYQEQSLRRRSAEIDQSIAFIERQLPDIRSELEEASAALAEYREGAQSTQLSLGTQELLDRAVAIEGALEELDFREEQLSQRLTPNHPDYRALLAERDDLLQRLEGTRAKLRDLPEAEQDLARLTERVEGARMLERQLASRVEQLRVLQASTVGNIRVLEPAEVASLIGPDRLTPALVGAAIGAIGAILLVFAVNLLRRGIEDARDIEALGLSLFGSVAKVPSLVGKGAIDPGYALADADPNHQAIEALRGLRTGLQFALAAADTKSVMLTSCSPGDGKSFISLNLAIVTARAGSRVLLVDADMRRGRLARAMGVGRRQPGLSDILVGRRDFAECVVPYGESGLDFIATGGYPPNPAEMLAGPRLEQFVRQASQSYDLVLLDAPPALAVTDPGILGQMAGITLLVVRHLVTSEAEIQSAQKTLATSGVRLSGVVMNQYDVKRSRYGYYSSKYSYQYGGYQYRYQADE